MQLTFPILVGIALADSVNPVSFGVLINILKKVPQKQMQEKIGYEYISSYISTYIGIGLVFIFLFSVLTQIGLVFFSLLGVVVLLLGLLEVNRITHIHHQLNRLLPSPKSRINHYTQTATQTHPHPFTLGMTTAIQELRYSGGFYLGISGLLALQGRASTNLLLLFVYNFIVAIPLILIVILLKTNDSVAEFKLWKPSVRRPMMLGIGWLQVILGIWLMFWWFV